MLEFSVLGPLEVRADGQPLALGGAKRRALLALLLVRANEVVSTDRLIDELWGENPPETAANTMPADVTTPPVPAMDRMMPVFKPAWISSLNRETSSRL